MSLIFSGVNGQCEMDYQKIYNSKNFNPGLYLVRTLIIFLRKLYEANPELGFKIFSDGTSKEEAFRSLLITTRYDWETNYRSKRPTILISHENISRGLAGIQGNAKIIGFEENGSVARYTDLISVPIVLECLSENDIEAEMLSSITQTFLAMDHRPLQSFGIQIQAPPVQTPARLIEKANITFNSSVILTLAMQIQYRAKTLSGELLDRFKVEINNLNEINIK